ncbi:heavy-metal-associated domain-containing protein [Microbacterium sp. P26]|uniref:heavy-metal-associated domain-containing protein n=1 Tax=Microbacterium TaxID=33882 RepID=UPI0020416031|nr:heavy-metal-associated domain-containing protein [Microbacterium sp. P26]MCM3502886.1 heavy-metal-associated domain-containing protein [Microbacterium sp. P26]
MTEQRIDLGLSASTPTSGGCGDACGCGHGAAASAPSNRVATDELRVEGMTCDHCVRAVTEELSALNGVEVLDVDLHVGGASIVRIASTGAVDEAALAGAIDEAGYTLAT